MTSVRVVNNSFIECKTVNATPMTHGEFYAKTAYPIEYRRGRPSDPGYMVTYPDMHMDWVPKEAFESSHFLVPGENFEVTEDLINSFISSMDTRVDGSLVSCAATLVTGQVVVESVELGNGSSSDQGRVMCRRMVRDKVVFLLEFLINCSLRGFNGSVYNDGSRSN